MSTFQPNKKRCIECVRLVDHVNASQVCSKCIKAELRAIRRSHDEIVARING
jgi:hypothetical protein